MSPVAGTVMFLKGGMLMPASTLGWSSGWLMLTASIVTISAVVLAYQLNLPRIWSGFQIIGDGSVRDATPAKGSGSKLSPGERELVRRARDLLTKEIALARDVHVGDAEAWIDGQLANAAA